MSEELFSMNHKTFYVSLAAVALFTATLAASAGYMAGVNAAVKHFKSQGNDHQRKTFSVNLLEVTKDPLIELSTGCSSAADFKISEYRNDSDTISDFSSQQWKYLISN